MTQIRANRPAAILELALVDAPHPVSQDAIRAQALELFRGAEFDVQRLAAVFASGGIQQRNLALPIDEYSRVFGPEERNRRFLDVARELLIGAAERAVAPHRRQRLTHVVTICSSGIATPSLECDVIEALGLPEGLRRIPVFGLGCAGGVAGLQIARDLSRAQPDALVLVLCVELTSLTLLSEDLSPRNLVACSLFGDGAAAALVGSARDGDGALAHLGGGISRLFPGTRDLMGWEVRDEGWQVVFSSAIPGIVREHAATLSAATAAERPRHFVLHPGGRRILEAYRDSLELNEEELAPARRVLERFGNMSAVTALYVLDEVLRAPDFHPGPAVMMAFGPGFTAEALELSLLRAPGAA